MELSSLNTIENLPIKIISYIPIYCIPCEQIHQESLVLLAINKVGLFSLHDSIKALGMLVVVT